MRVLLAGLLLLRASLTFAQQPAQLCDSASAATVGQEDGVIVQKAILSGKWGSNEAKIYLPPKEIADGAVLFSHSAIHVDDGTSVDLLPFALTLASAGAAVIVPQRALAWPPKDQSSNREGAVVVCAEHWLVDHVKVFDDGKPTVNERNILVRGGYAREGYAYVGPRICDPADAFACEFTTPYSADTCGLTPYCRTFGWVPLGETEGVDNTRDMLSDGGLKAARWLARRLGLARINTLVAASAPRP